jgi:nicotinamide/nicotinate riboside kinase
MDAALAHIRTHGEIPVRCPPSSPSSPFSSHFLLTHSLTPRIQPWLKSKEDQNAVGPVPISPSFIHSQKLRVESWLRTLPPSPGCCPKICLVDGFLLYTPALDRVTRHVQSHARLLLLASRERVFARRAARTGYVTLEGFWADPPGYVERVVWPNYVDAHGWLFEDGNVEGGRLDREVLKRAGIEAVEAQEGDDGDDADVDLERVLEWAVGRVMRAVDEFAGRSDGSEV